MRADARGSARQWRCVALALLVTAACLAVVVVGPGLLAFEVAVAQHWSSYQLSDAVRAVWQEEDAMTLPAARRKYAAPFPGSLVDKYLDAQAEAPTEMQKHLTDFYGGRAFDVVLLERLVKELVAPDARTLVVHLRMADALLHSSAPVRALWEGTHTAHLVRSKHWFACSLGGPELDMVGFERVVFLSSNSHVNHKQLLRGAALRQRGQQYRALVHAWFGQRLPDAALEWRSTHYSPDHDFAYLASAQHLVPGAGGFGAAAAVLAQRGGGMVYQGCR